MPNHTFHHIHLTSPDPVKTARFYQDMFDAELTGTRELPNGGVTAEVDLGGALLLIMPRAAEGDTVPSSDSALDHFGIRTDDMDATVAKLKANGVEFRGDVRELGRRMRIAFFWAPEKVLIELVEIKPREE
jgi:lactoylglutathione lyase